MGQRRLMSSRPSHCRGSFLSQWRRFRLGGQGRPLGTDRQLPGQAGMDNRGPGRALGGVDRQLQRPQEHSSQGHPAPLRKHQGAGFRSHPPLGSRVLALASRQRRCQLARRGQRDPRPERRRAQAEPLRATPQENPIRSYSLACCRPGSPSESAPCSCLISAGHGACRRTKGRPASSTSGARPAAPRARLDGVPCTAGTCPPANPAPVRPRDRARAPWHRP